MGQARRRRAARNISARAIRRERDSYRGREHIAAAVTHARVLRNGRGRAVNDVLDTASARARAEEVV
jgi:hypothetical protein